MRDNQSCIDTCMQCFIECRNCLVHMAGKESKNDCPKCCVECADACLMAVQSLISNSAFAKEYCRLCAEICDWCAEQCGQHDHTHCQQCADACKKCAEECRAMA